MRKSAKIALWLTGAILVAAGSASAGFYAGFGVGARTMSAMSETNEAYGALSEVSTSMVALGKNDPYLSQRQLAIHLRMALYQLGALSGARAYAPCSQKEKDVLADAASYVTTHADSALFKADEFLTRGMEFCAFVQGSPGTSKTGA
jgi:hypothetical protein